MRACSLLLTISKTRIQIDKSPTAPSALAQAGPVEPFGPLLRGGACAVHFYDAASCYLHFQDIDHDKLFLYQHVRVSMDFL